MAKKKQTANNKNQGPLPKPPNPPHNINQADVAHAAGKFSDAVKNQTEQAYHDAWFGDDEGILFNANSENKELARFNKVTGWKNMGRWIRHMQLNTDRIHGDYVKTGGKCDMAFFYSKLFNAKKIALVGGGPSLDLAVDTLRKFDGPILTGLTSAPLLVAHGIRPTAVVVVDAHDLMVNYARYVPLHSLGVALICPPTIHPGVLEMWPSNVFYHLFYAHGTGQKGRNAYNFIQNYMYPMIRVRYVPTGCVANQMLIITMDIQRWLGTVFRPVSLWGYDFGYSTSTTLEDGTKLYKPHCDFAKYMHPLWLNKQLHFPWTELDPELFLINQVTNPTDDYTTLVDKATGHPTTKVLQNSCLTFLNYLDDLENQVKQGVGMPLRIINCSRGLLDKALPYSYPVEGLGEPSDG